MAHRCGSTWWGNATPNDGSLMTPQSRLTQHQVCFGAVYVRMVFYFIFTALPTAYVERAGRWRFHNTTIISERGGSLLWTFVNLIEVLIHTEANTRENLKGISKEHRHQPRP